MDEEDPTADFLAREQAILGAEAALFGNPLTSPGSAATGTGTATGGKTCRCRVLAFALLFYLNILL